MRSKKTHWVCPNTRVHSEVHPRKCTPGSAHQEVHTGKCTPGCALQEMHSRKCTPGFRYLKRWFTREPDGDQYGNSGQFSIEKKPKTTRKKDENTYLTASCVFFLLLALTASSQKPRDCLAAAWPQAPSCAQLLAWLPPQTAAVARGTCFWNRRNFLFLNFFDNLLDIFSSFGQLSQFLFENLLGIYSHWGFLKFLNFSNLPI